MKRNFTILLLMLLCISLLTPVYAAQAIPSEVFGEEAINKIFNASALGSFNSLIASSTDLIATLHVLGAAIIKLF